MEKRRIATDIAAYVEGGLQIAARRHDHKFTAATSASLAQSKLSCRRDQTIAIPTTGQFSIEAVRW
ncbi:MAG: hypothetical protein QGI52_00440, partial [Alphaproteobacteria bacterium]|nr:hypothetical protein [Alphaproteobacteria bacterium]